MLSPTSSCSSNRQGSVAMYALYYYPGNASLLPHMALREIGATFELRLVDRTQDAQKSPDYLRLNPNGRIPVLIDGDLVLFETAAIVLHLVDGTLRRGSRRCPARRNVHSSTNGWFTSPIRRKPNTAPGSTLGSMSRIARCTKASSRPLASAWAACSRSSPNNWAKVRGSWANDSLGRGPLPVHAGEVGTADAASARQATAARRPCEPRAGALGRAGDAGG